MAHWLTRAVKRIRELATQDRIRLTMKAVEEIEALDPELTEEDVFAVVGQLERHDFTGRLVSKATGEWLYVFKPYVDARVVYVKLVLRSECVLVSFHEDDEDET